ncbi:hypothetical protein D9M71_751780 [compost metagenome]
MLGVSRVGLQGSLGFELGIEHDIAGMIDATEIDANLQVRHAGDASAQLLEQLLHPLSSGTTLAVVSAGHLPHDNVLDHFPSLDSENSRGIGCDWATARTCHWIVLRK